MFGKELSVSLRQRYIATWRQKAICCVRFFDFKSASRTWKESDTIFWIVSISSFSFLVPDEVAQRLAREINGDRAFVERSDGGQPGEAAFKLAHVRCDILRDKQRDIRRQMKVFQGGLLLHDRDPRLEVWRSDVGDQAGLETIPQAFFESGDIARHFVRGQNYLMTVRVQGIEGMEELLLGPFAAGQELNVVED